MDAAMIFLADDAGKYLEVQAAAGNKNFGKGMKLKVGDGLAGRVFQEGVPMKIDNIAGHEEEIYPEEFCKGKGRPLPEELGIKSALAVPLHVGGKVAGILQLGSGRPGAFATREWGLIQILADRASLAVQNSMLHNKTKQELARVALLKDVAAACAGLSDLKSIAERALKAIYEQLGCLVAGIFYLDRRQNALVNLAFLGHPAEVVKEFKVISLDRETFLTRAVKERKIITHETHPTEPASESEVQILQALAVEKNRRVALPIIYKDQVVGGMALAFPGQKPFSAAGIETLKSIANQLAIAIHNSQLPEEIEA